MGPSIEETVDFQLHLNTESVKFAHPTEPLIVAPGDSIRDVLTTMKEHREACVLVMEGEQLVGIFTERDALRIMAHGHDLDRSIAEVMATQIETISLEQPVGEAISKMSAGGYRRLPIVDQGKPVGVLSVPGILRYLVEHFPTVIYTLPPDPHHAMQEREGA
jgi:CBS domain-containing protein